MRVTRPYRARTDPPMLRLTMPCNANFNLMWKLNSSIIHNGALPHLTSSHTLYHMQSHLDCPSTYLRACHNPSLYLRSSHRSSKGTESPHSIISLLLQPVSRAIDVFPLAITSLLQLPYALPLTCTPCCTPSYSMLLPTT